MNTTPDPDRPTMRAGASANVNGAPARHGPGMHRMRTPRFASDSVGAQSGHRIG